MPSTIKGEYWLIDGFPTFADGSQGDIDHSTYALLHIRSHILTELGGDDDSEDLGDFSRFRDALFDTCGVCGHEAVRMKLEAECTDPHLAIQLLPAAFEDEDPREAAMRVLGWKWVKRDWIATQTWTPEDRREITQGVDRMLDEEEFEDVPTGELEIRIASIEKSLFLSFEALLRHDRVSALPVSPAIYAPDPGQGYGFGVDRRAMPRCYALIGD